MTHEIGGPPPIYHSFLLRLRRESEQGIWRASLENVTTGERHGFANLAGLYAFLQTMSQAPGAQGTAEPGEQQH